jgi:hypothetical protein
MRQGVDAQLCSICEARIVLRSTKNPKFRSNTPMPQRMRGWPPGADSRPMGNNARSGNMVCRLTMLSLALPRSCTYVARRTIRPGMGHSLIPNFSTMSKCRPTKAINSPGTTKTCSAKNRESVAPAMIGPPSIRFTAVIPCSCLLEPASASNERNAGSVEIHRFTLTTGSRSYKCGSSLPPL